MSLRRSERWIRTAVRVFDDDSGFTGSFCERSAWLWLIANAAWKDTRHRVRGTLHDVARGTLFVTVRDLMDAWGWGNTKVVNFLTMLEKQDRIKRETKTGKTLITICNYSSYQDAEENTRQPQDTDKTAARQPQDTKGTKGTKGTKDITPKRAASIPENWTPDERDVEHAVSKGFTQPEIMEMANAFRDYHLAKGGRYKDWNACWRTWCRNARRFGGGSKTGKPSPGSGNGGTSLAAIAARREAARQNRGQVPEGWGELHDPDRGNDWSTDGGTDGNIVSLPMPRSR